MTTRLCTFVNGSWTRQVWWDNLVEANEHNVANVEATIMMAGAKKVLDKREWKHYLVFENDADATAFVLRWS
jgi:hypothetical protein